MNMVDECKHLGWKGSVPSGSTGSSAASRRFNCSTQPHQIYLGQTRAHTNANYRDRVTDYVNTFVRSSLALRGKQCRGKTDRILLQDKVSSRVFECVRVCVRVKFNIRTSFLRSVILVCSASSLSSSSRSATTSSGFSFLFTGSESQVRFDWRR